MTLTLVCDKIYNMTEHESHEPLTEAEQRRRQIIAEAIEARKIAFDLMAEHSKLYRFLSSNRQILDDPELEGRRMSETRANEDRLDEINRIFGRLSVNDTETPE